MDSQEKTFKNPLEEQRGSALEHYKEASKAVHHWSSFVESAIKAYNPENCPPTVSAEKLYTEKDMGNLWQYVVDGAKNIMLGKTSGIVGFEDYIATVSPVSPSPSAPVVAEQAPQWYTKETMYMHLINSNYSSFIAEELSTKWADMLQGAFKKGWEKGYNDFREAGTDYKYLPENASLHSPAERIEGDAVDCVYEIDFDGHLLCKLKVIENKIQIEGAMNGWGDGVSIDKIKITELQKTTP